MAINPDFNIDITRDVLSITVSEEGGIYPENNFGPISYNNAILQDSLGTSNYYLFDSAPNAWCYICSVSNPSYLRFRVNYRTSIDIVKSVVCNAGMTNPEYKVENGSTTVGSRIYIRYDNVTDLYYVFCRQPAYADSYCDIEIIQAQGTIVYYFTSKGTGATPSDPVGTSTSLDTDSDDSIWPETMGHLVLDGTGSSGDALTIRGAVPIQDYAPEIGDISYTDDRMLVSAKAIFNRAGETRTYTGPFASYDATVEYGRTGNKVMVGLEGYTVASTGAAPITVQAPSSAIYSPNYIVHGIIRTTVDNGATWIPSHYAVQVNGSIVIYNGMGTTNFPTGAGEIVGFEETTISYIIRA
jgi:hypothetical protein